MTVQKSLDGLKKGFIDAAALREIAAAFDAEIVDYLKSNFGDANALESFIGNALASFSKVQGIDEKLRSDAVFRLVNAWQQLNLNEPKLRSNPQQLMSITGAAFRALIGEKKAKAAGSWSGVEWQDVLDMIRSDVCQGEDALIVGHRYKNYWGQDAKSREARDRLYRSLKNPNQKLMALIHWGYEEKDFREGLEKLIEQSAKTIDYALFGLKDMTPGQRAVFWKVLAEKQSQGLRGVFSPSDRARSRGFRRAVAFWLTQGGDAGEILRLFPDLQQRDYDLYALAQASAAVNGGDGALATSWLKDVRDDQTAYTFLVHHFPLLATHVGKVNDHRLRMMALRAARQAPYSAEEMASILAGSGVIPDRDSNVSKQYAWVDRLFHGTPLRRPIVSLLNARRFYMDAMKRYESSKAARETHFRELILGMLQGNVKGRTILAVLKEPNLSRRQRQELLGMAPPWVIAAAGALGYIPKGEMNYWYDTLKNHSPILKTVALLTWQGRIPFIPPLSLYLREFGKEINNTYNPLQWVDNPGTPDEIFKFGGTRVLFYTALYVLSPINWALGIRRIASGLLRDIGQRAEDFRRFRAAYKAAKIQNAIMRSGPALLGAVSRSSVGEGQSVIRAAQIQSG